MYAYVRESRTQTDTKIDTGTDTYARRCYEAVVAVVAFCVGFMCSAASSSVSVDCRASRSIVNATLQPRQKEGGGARACVSV